MKKIALVISLFSIFISAGIYFSRDYQYEKFLIEDKKDLVKKYNVNLNLAIWQEFDNLPGIGEVIAKEIIQDRETRGRFNTIEDIKRVHGIGAAKFAAIKDYLTLEVD